jgi:antitoxin (DNA-binding transcriptional repressor) of toxin-antitoxin stability system
MPQPVLDLAEVRSRLPELIRRAAAGEEIRIGEDDRPVVKLVPCAAAPQPRRPGGWAGRARVGDDFDAPLPQAVLDAFEGGA